MRPLLLTFGFTSVITCASAPHPRVDQEPEGSVETSPLPTTGDSLQSVPYTDENFNRMVKKCQTIWDQNKCDDYVNQGCATVSGPTIDWSDTNFDRIPLLRCLNSYLDQFPKRNEVAITHFRTCKFLLEGFENLTKAKKSKEPLSLFACTD